MTAEQRRLQVTGWQAIAKRTLQTAQLAYEHGDWRSAVSRAYYAAYQVTTSLCILHGDEGNFPDNWNNPSHDQLPSLIQNNGTIELSARRRVSQLLVALRATRESADYRVGRTVNDVIALESLEQAVRIFKLIGVEP